MCWNLRRWRSSMYWLQIGGSETNPRKAPNAKWTHCFLHKEALAAKKLSPELQEILNFVVKCVNLIKARPLNQHLFSSLCADVDADHKALLLHTEVRWLSRGRVLKRVRRRCCRRLKGIHSRPDTNRTGAEGLSFYYTRLLHFLDRMLAVMLLSQHRVSSSKTVRPRAPCGARCIGHTVSTWSAVCSEAPHWQFGEGARPHLCMDEWNRPTSVCRRLSLTQAARGKPIPTGLALVRGTKARSLEAFSQYSVFHL